MSKELTAKEEKFAREWAKTGNKSEAYRRAYNCEGWKEGSINTEACKLSQRPNIIQRFDELNKNAADLVGITKAKILKELALMAFSNIVDTDTNDISKLPENVQKAIKKQKRHTRYNKDGDPTDHVEVEMHDKLKAIETINKMLGLNAADKIDISGSMLNVKSEDISEDPAEAARQYSEMIKSTKNE